MSDPLTGFTLLRPFWLLLILPALWLVFALYRRGQDAGQWQRLISPELQPWLLARQRGKGHRGRYLLLAIGWCLAIVVLSGPAWQSSDQTVRNDRSALVILLDVSSHMLASDPPPSRLQQAQRKVRDISQQYAGSQIALIAYAGSAHQVVPLSTDARTLHALVDSLHPDIMPATGQRLDLGLRQARRLLDALPPERSHLLLLTPGIDPQQLDSLRQHAAELGPRLLILGIGSAEGAPLPAADGGFSRDADGGILLSRLDAPALASIARRHGGGYHGLTLDDTDIDYLLHDLFQAGEQVPDNQSRLSDQGHWLLLLLVALTALGARRGLLPCLLLVLWLPPQAQANWWQDLWLRPDQQASRLLAEGQPEAAARRFQDPAWQAWALYASGDYEAAADAWGQLVNTHPDQVDYHFNHGTALALAGRYTAALEAFEQTLTRAPEHQAARHNRNRVEAYLESLQQQQPDAATALETDTTTPDNTDSQQITPEQAADTTDARPDSAATDSPADAPASTGDSAAETIPGLSEPLPQASEPVSPRRWLDEIEDNPGELLRRKFRHQFNLSQEDA